MPKLKRQHLLRHQIPKRPKPSRNITGRNTAASVIEIEITAKDLIRAFDGCFNWRHAFFYF
jgi:hypothetical protein